MESIMKVYQALVYLFAISGLAHSQKSVETLTALGQVQLFSTPNYPSNYDNRLQYTWIISAPEGEQVEILFVNILTETCCDYVLVRDGESSHSPILGNFRGNITDNLDFISSFGALHITFKSDDSITDVGIQVEYRSLEVNSTCGDTSEGTSAVQLISSPGWPSPYPANSYCTWTIIAQPDEQILLTILFTSLESCCDNLLIRDGTNETSPILAYFRGSSTRNFRYASTNGVLQLRFRSNNRKNLNGFIATYVSTTGIKRAELSPSLVNEECGEELEVPAVGHANFSSPGFPGVHANDLMCAWIITAQPNQRIHLWFSFVLTELCCDWIKIRDGPNSNSRKLGVISGDPKTFHSYISSGPIIRVEFDSDYSQNGVGFSAYYETFTETGDNQFTTTCGGEFMAQENLQYISTPNWPESYPNDTECEWIISAEFGLNVELHLLGAITESFFDFIHIYSGQGDTRRPVLHLSGKSFQSFLITSDGPIMTVILSADSSINHGGFRASYRAVSSETSETTDLPDRITRDGKNPR